MSFFAGNSKLILIKKQDDKDTAVVDFSTARAFRVYEWAAPAARAIGALGESDATTQQGRSHVSAIGPSFTFGVYGRPSELDFLAEALLGDNDDSATLSPTTHIATPGLDQPYYSALEVLPYGAGVGPRWDGCRLFAGQFASQDDGDTELRVTGLAWTALGITHGVDVPDPLPTPADELPFIHAEVAISYNEEHIGLTRAVAWTINRNGGRRQGDSGFRAADATPGLFQQDGQFTRYTRDDTILRAIDTGTTTGTDPTTTIFSESASVLYERGTGADLRSFLIAAPEVAYESREEALNLDGTPYAEVLGFRGQPQASLADAVALVTVNDKETTG